LIEDGSPNPAVLGRHRRLLRLADDRGVLTGFALDHRDSFIAALTRAGLGGVDPALAAQLKQALFRALAGAASAVMVDAEIGRPSLNAATIPADVALIMPLEAQGYEQQGDRRLTELMANFTPSTALALGADACKLLVPIRPDIEALATAQYATVREARDRCHAVGLPIVVEPVVYRLSSESEGDYSGQYTDLVIQAAGTIAELGPDLLKLPFPVLAGAGESGEAGGAGAADAGRRLAGTIGATPWVLLGAGVSQETFLWQLGHAGRAGASGFLVGRSIWADCLTRDPARTEALARQLGLPRLQACATLANEVCRPLG